MASALCLNIDNGPEWALAQEQFKTIGMEVERFPAIVEDNRVLAFNKSVHAALSLMPEGGWLFEDDVMFDDRVGVDMLIKQAISKLPSGFNTLHLGCNIIGMDTTVWKMPEFYCRGVAKLYNCFQSHATYYSKETVQYIISHLAIDRVDEDNNIFDDWLRRKVLSDGNSYLLNPMLAYQRPRQSAIWGGQWADYTGAHIQGNNWLKNHV